uniref:Molybdenum cofactor synthesis 1 n=1 Tax=Homo sapiens TaxID=9606 RepID=A0AAQ5BGP5_HUMAN
MAARPLSRMLRRLLRSSARSCSSGAPVTQPCPGESARAASEVSTACPRRGSR